LPILKCAKQFSAGSIIANSRGIVQALIRFPRGESDKLQSWLK
jgi:hypothetical protein